MNENITWLEDLPDNVKRFMKNQKSTHVEGYYSYSVSGDLFSDAVKWNVGSSCYALKILYTLGVDDSDEVKSLIKYIHSFKKNDNAIYDELIVNRSFVRNFLSSIKHKRLDNLLHQNYKRAETRQCLSALDLYGAIPQSFSITCPSSEAQIHSFLSNLNWNLPWAAGSHFSHLLFFLNKKHKLGQIDNHKYSELVEFTLEWISRYQISRSGGWGSNVKGERNIINGSMKVITGLQNVGISNFQNAEQLIDTCLKYSDKGHACDNFNIVYVLNKLNKSLGGSYRYNEICDFMLKKLLTYKEHYKPDSGGFSFNKNSSNVNYYGLNITRGLDEADIHGTVLFLWGACLISDTLEIKIGLREFMS